MKKGRFTPRCFGANCLKERESSESDGWTKGDAENKAIRCRLVAMDFKDGDRPGLIAGTPPTERMTMICSELATVDGEEEKTCLMINDVKRAYSYAPVKRL